MSNCPIENMQAARIQLVKLQYWNNLSFSFLNVCLDTYVWALKENSSFQFIQNVILLFQFNFGYKPTDNNSLLVSQSYL